MQTKELNKIVGAAAYTYGRMERGGQYLHHSGALYNQDMSAKPKSGERKHPSVRQSVTLPAKLAAEVHRVANERHLTTSRALVELAQRGVEAEAQARENLAATYNRFMSEADPALKGDAGKDLIRAIFGTEAIAEDSIR